MFKSQLETEKAPTLFKRLLSLRLFSFKKKKLETLTFKQGFICGEFLFSI